MNSAMARAQQNKECMVKIHEYWWHAPTNGYANLRLFAVSNFNPGGCLKVDVFVYHCQVWLHLHLSILTGLWYTHNLLFRRIMLEAWSNSRGQIRAGHG